MKKKVVPITPRCGLCKKLYDVKDDDGSGLCLKCRPENGQPVLAVKRQIKQTIVMEVGNKMDDFDKEELQNQESMNDQKAEEQEVVLSEGKKPNLNDVVESLVTPEQTTDELKIEDIIKPGRYGVTNGQMIPAMKAAIAEQSVEKLALLKKSYFYVFDKSVRYLKKAEREFIAKNGI